MDNRRTSLILVVILIVSTLSYVIIVLPSNVRAATLFVGGTGPGNYTTIQSAIDDASPGDTVFVYSGTYEEDISISKKVTLVGEDRDKTIITSATAGHVIEIIAGNTVVEGFTVTGSASGAAIGLRASNCTIMNNNLTDNDDGIFMDAAHNNKILNNTIANTDGIWAYNSNGNTFSNNNITDNYYGILLMNGDGNIVANNFIFLNFKRGIYITSSFNSYITNNTIFSNSHEPGIHIRGAFNTSLSKNSLTDDGIYLDGSMPGHWSTSLIDTSNTVNGRPVIFWKNVDGGSVPEAGQVILYDCTGVTVENQNLSHGSVGVHLVFSPGTTIANNNVSFNDKAGVLVYKSNSNLIHNNSAFYSGIQGTTTGKAINIEQSHNNIVTGNSASISGISLRESNINYIANNTVMTTSGTGIGASGYYNVIANNTVSENSWGISVGWSNNVIENNTALASRNDGIALWNSIDSTVILNNASTNGRSGIYLDKSTRITVSHNIASWNEVEGIALRDSSNNTIAYNNASWNDNSGIYLGASENTTIIGNRMLGDGVYISGWVEDWNSHIIDTTNTVSEKPVYYWKDVDGGTVPSGAGQVILANCTNVVVRDQNVSWGSVGIHLGYSENNVILNNTASYNSMRGIYLVLSDWNQLEKNTASFNDEDGIELFDSENTTLDGNIANSNKRSGIYVRNSDNVSLTNNVLIGNKDGISTTGSQYSIIHSNNASWNDRDGIHFSSYFASVTNNVVTFNEAGIVLAGARMAEVRNNTVSWNRRYGIWMSRAMYATLHDNMMVEDGIYFLWGYLENWNTHTIDSSNTVNGKPVYYWKNVTGGSIPSDAGQVILANCSYVTVDGLNVSDGTVGIVLGYSKQNEISNNVASGNTEEGIFLFYSDNNSISGNIASYNKHGMTLWASKNASIAGNVMVEDGIYFRNQPDYVYTHQVDSNNLVNGKPVIFWNDVHNRTVPLDAGQVILTNCSDIVVEGQNLVKSSLGILITYSTEIMVVSNTADSNSGEGITIFRSNKTFVYNNTLSFNGRGIDLLDADEITVFNNTISENEYGIRADTWYRVKIYHNNLLFNSVQAITHVPSYYFHSWDDGHPSGGNYWSDYSGVDDCSGPNQDVCPDPDGIGDTAYWIEFGDTDRYPLMSPLVFSHTPPFAPQNLLAAPGSQQVTLTWNAPFEGGSPITNYRIYRGTTPGGEILLTEIGNVLTYTDTGLVNGQTYYYQVSAVNAIGEGPKSNEASATPATLPDPPQNLTATAGDQQVSLSWSPPSSDGGSAVTNYRIHRGTTPGGEVFLKEVGNVTSYVDTGLSNGQTYYYQVSAVNAIGEGLRSNEALATPTTHPGPPLDLQAVLSGKDLENVTIGWVLSPDDGGGQNSVIGYAIYRNTDYDANGTGYGLIVLLPSGTSEFIDTNVGDGDTNSYFYQICAIDLNNKTTCTEEQAAKYSKHLATGLVLLSIPLDVSNNSITSVFQTVSYSRVLSYDAKAGKKHSWKVFDKRKPYSKSFDVNHTMALWVEVTAESYLTIAGVVPKSTTIHLQVGWNFVGYPSFVDRTVSDTLSTHYQTIESFDPNNAPWFLKRLGDSDLMMAGEGYWIHVSQDYDWVITN